MHRIARLCRPFAGPVGRLRIAGFYVLLAIFLLGRCRCKRVFCAAVAATLACAVAFSMLPGDAALTFTALNVGQGQCLLLQPGGLTVVALARPEWLVEIDATAVIPD